MSSQSIGGALLTLVAAITVAGCAHTRTPASLVQARTLYDSLESVGARERAEADMLRARDAIAQADSVVAEDRPQEYADAVAHIALRTAQTAAARNAMLLAREASDSLRTARLTQLLNLTQAQRDQLAAQNQLSREEIAALRERNLIVSQREDSLARQVDSLQVETATGAVETETLREQAAMEQARSDSLRQVAELAAQQMDSLRRVAEEASREQTAAEQQQSDSLQRVAELATQQSDSLRRLAEAVSQQQDSAPIAQDTAPQTQPDTLFQTQQDTAAQAQPTEQADSLRAVADVATREADSLRAEVAAANRRLSDSLAVLRSTITELREVRETERGLVLGLSGVLFDVGQADLKPGAERNLGRIAEVLQQYPDYRLAVEGHTDSTGSPELNQRLSEERAEAVKRALVAGGVDEQRITAQGFGASQPVATNATPAGRQSNRRVEIVVLGAGTSEGRQ